MLVCDRCGVEKNKCIHRYDADYMVEDSEVYRKGRLQALTFIVAALLITIGVSLWLLTDLI